MMSSPPDSGQNVFPSRSALLALGLAGGTALASLGFFLSAPDAPVAAVPRAEIVPLPVAKQPPIVREAASPQAPAPPAPARDIEPSPSLATLEQRFHAARAKEDRIDLAREIAGQNDAAAVVTLVRIFPLERHPEIKVALLASLNDINHDAAPDARIALLTAALHGQPRDVRTTALDSLAQLDDPRVLPLLKKVMREDPDREVRDAAAALFRARLEAEPR